MNELISVKPDKTRLINILDEIKRGRIKIPKFQRDFIWDEKQMLQLFDSMEKGYPIGSLLFWHPETDKFSYYNHFGPFKIQRTSNDIKYVLDGFQRLSTLFGVLSNPDKHEKTENVSLFKKCNIYYDLKEEEFTYNKKKKREIYLIPLYVLVDTFEFLSYVDELRNNIENEVECNVFITRAKELATKLVDYEIPFIDIKGGDINSSVDIFSRINSTGTSISIDWMVSALSYNQDENFLFSERIESFLSELEKYNYGNLNRQTILHCIESATNKPYFDVKAEDLARRPNFRDLVLSTLNNIKTAINFLIEELHVIEYKLLPYNTQLIFITEFFRLNSHPTKNELLALKEWFWITSYSNYFTLYSLSNQRKAFSQFKEFAIGNAFDPVYYQDKEQMLTTLPFPNRIDFGSVRSKTLILFMLNHLYDRSLYSSDYTPQLDMRFLVPTVKDFTSLIVQRSDSNSIPMNYLNKKSDANYLFENNNIYELELFFIDDDMLSYYMNNDTDSMLSARLGLMQFEESMFTSKLNLVYNYEYAQ